MKDVAGTLKRLDEEITERRQKIAFHQVEIMRLEDTRKVLMTLAEDDAATERSDEAIRMGHNGGQVRLIVRKTTTEGEEPPPKAPGTNKNGDRRGMHQRQGKGGRSGRPTLKGDLSAEKMRERVMVTLRSKGKPMTTSDIRAALGLSGPQAVKTLQNAVYKLRSLGRIAANDAYQYTLSH